MRQSAYMIILCGCLFFFVPFFSIAGKATDPVKSAQEALKASGIDPGPIDGIMGSRTKAAIKTYQLENNLPETGLLDAETRRALGLFVSGEGGGSKQSNRPRDHRMITPADTQAAGSNVPPAEKPVSKNTVADEIITVDGGEGSLSHHTSAQVDRVYGVYFAGDNVDEGRLRPSTFVGIMMISGFALAALRPLGWVVLTGGGLMAVVLMSHWIGGYFNTIAYGVFTCAYVSPVLYRLVSKAWDMALIFALFLGTPVLLISNYAFGFDWWAAGCYGFAGMTLLPEGYRRIFSKRRYRPPYGTLYYRF